MTDDRGIAEGHLSDCEAEVKRLRAAIAKCWVCTDWMREAERLRAAVRRSLALLTETPSLGESVADCDGSAWDAAQVLREALDNQPAAVHDASDGLGNLANGSADAAGVRADPQTGRVAVRGLAAAHLVATDLE